MRIERKRRKWNRFRRLFGGQRRPWQPPFDRHVVVRQRVGGRRARKIYKIITDKKPDHTSSIGGDADAEAAVVNASPTEALTEDDLAIEWRLPRTPLASK